MIGLDIKKTVKVQAKEIRLFCKIRDYFTAHIYDQNGDVIGGQDDGYVPEFMPGEHYGDYIILNIDLVTGKINNWRIPTKEQIEDFIHHED